MLVLVLGMLVVLSAVVGVIRGMAMVARHRAESAADLAALTAAASVIDGAASACAAAGEVARDNGAQVSDCVVAGDVVEVVVVRPLRLGRLGTWTASGRARAGPGRSDGQPGNGGPEPRRPDWRRT